MGAKVQVCSDGLTWMFSCPGCKMYHSFSVEPGQWTFDGIIERPTFSPSLLVRSGHYASGKRGLCWCDFEERTGKPPAFSCGVCHSFVRSGMIEFLSDCTHELAGQTVPMEDID